MQASVGHGIGRRLSAALVALLVTLQPALTQTGTNPFYSENVEAFRFGIYCAEEPTSQVDAPHTASGVVNLVPNDPEFIQRTTRVPAELGVGFGVLAMMAPGASLDKAMVTITHPPYPDSGITTERWQTEFSDQSFGLVGFSFDTPNELVPGVWRITVVHAGEVLFDIAFDVLAPSDAPELSGLCSGTFTS